MESYYSYDLGDPSYAQALLGDKHHWVCRLPGQLLHNVISHGIARIAEFLTSDDPQVIAYGFVSPVLKGIGETGNLDELRVIIAEEERTTAYFTFSSQLKPSVHEFRIYGSKNGLDPEPQRRNPALASRPEIQELRGSLHPPATVC